MSNQTVDQLNAEAQRVIAEGMRAANVMPEQLYFGLHIGPPGSGKTHTIGTMPGKVLVLDCRDGGNGTAPLVDQGERIQVFPVTDWTQVKHAIRFLATGEHDFSSVAIDGVSKLQDYDLRHIIDNAPPNEKGRKPTFMELAMWGIARDHLTNFVNHMQGVCESRKLHCMMTVWEKELVEEKTENKMIPDIQGSMKNRLAGMFDVVVYHVTKGEPGEDGGPEKIEYAALTVPFGDKVHAKCRWQQVLPDGTKRQALHAVEVDPNITEWIERIRTGTASVIQAKGMRVQSATAMEHGQPAQEAPAAPAPAPAQPAPAQAAPAAEPENVNAAAELAKSAEVTASKDQLLGNMKQWVETQAAQHPDKVAMIDAKMSELAKKHGVRQQFGELEVDALAGVIEQLMAFENELEGAGSA